MDPPPFPEITILSQAIVHRKGLLAERSSRNYLSNYVCCNKSFRAIFCKSHPTCDSRVFRISSYFNQLKINEYGRNFGFIKHVVEFLGGSRDHSSFSRNAISVPKLYFESHLSLLELLFRIQVTST